MHYVEKLDEVARLNICGIYEDDDAQGLHVFGRAFNTPPQYFYRKLNLTTHVTHRNGTTQYTRKRREKFSGRTSNVRGVESTPLPILANLHRKPDKEKIQQYNEDHKQWKKRHDRWKDKIEPIRERNRNESSKQLGSSRKK